MMFCQSYKISTEDSFI